MPPFVHGNPESTRHPARSPEAAVASIGSPYGASQFVRFRQGRLPNDPVSSSGSNIIVRGIGAVGRRVRHGSERPSPGCHCRSGAERHPRRLRHHRQRTHLAAEPGDHGNDVSSPSDDHPAGTEHRAACQHEFNRFSEPVCRDGSGAARHRPAPLHVYQPVGQHRLPHAGVGDPVERRVRPVLHRVQDVEATTAPVVVRPRLGIRPRTGSRGGTPASSVMETRSDKQRREKGNSSSLATATRSRWSPSRA